MVGAASRSAAMSGQDSGLILGASWYDYNSLNLTQIRMAKVIAYLPVLRRLFHDATSNSLAFLIPYFRTPLNTLANGCWLLCLIFRGREVSSQTN